MTTIATPDEATRAEVLATEERRQRALVEGDLDSLEELFDDSLVHIHAPGLSHTKAQLLEHVATRQAYLAITRGELNIRVAGDIAIVTGPIVNRLRTPEGGERTLGGVATQVLLRVGEGRWRFLSFQMTPAGEEMWPALPSERAGEDESSAERAAAQEEVAQEEQETP